MVLGGEKMNLKKLRENRELTQYKLSKISGIPQPSIFRIEKGLQNPGADIVIKLCDALGCTADELLGRKSE